MFKGKKVIVVMPAYNAEKTLIKTHAEVMSQEVVDRVILVDDCSSDGTFNLAQTIPDIVIVKHENNRGYGGNQKTCYETALGLGADIVIMVHPDYQYTPLLIPSMTALIANGLYHCVLGSRILGGHALAGGMPYYKYIANRFLTMFQNIMQGAKLSEYHTGYRAFSRELLETLCLEENSEDFVFDNQMLAQILWNDYQIAEISCPTKYFTDASSINFSRSVTYGLGCLKTSMEYWLAKRGIIVSKRFRVKARKEV